MSAGAEMRTSFSCTTGPPRTRSWRRASPQGATTSCTTTSSLSGRKATPLERRAATSPRGCAGSRVPGAPFISRGDRSGTHAAELRFWREAGVDPAAERAEWYKEIGQGMGPALNVASGSNAYVLTDRGTWLSFRNRGELTVLIEGDRRLFNQYGVMLVNPARHADVKSAEGQRLVDWLLSGEGQGAIASFKIDGEQLFFPNAGGPARS
jgi:tungstate transport system substrate-binding protein